MKTITFSYPHPSCGGYGCSEPGDNSGEYVRADVAKELLAALEPFADLVGEDDDDFDDETRVNIQFGRSTCYSIKLGHIRRALKAVTTAEGAE